MTTHRVHRARARRRPPRALHARSGAPVWLALLGAAAAPAQELELTLSGPSADLFGAAVDGLGDVDGDGFGDLVLGAPGWGGAAGAVEVRSGRDGALLRRHAWPAAAARFGESVAGVGDLDGDGVPDYAAAAREASAAGLAGCGVVRAHSGATGAVLWEVAGAAAGDRLGHALAAAGDLDGDGHADVLCGAYTMAAHGAQSGGALVVSGRDGRVLRTFLGEAAADQLGFALAGAGDVDGDGRPDLLLGAPGSDGQGPASGAASVRSGRDGALLLRLPGAAPGERFGAAVAPLGDVDGDGRADLAVAAPGARSAAGAAETGCVRALSGADGRPLWTARGAAGGDQFGLALAGTGDVDGDGVLDLVAGSYRDGGAGFLAGAAHVLSGRTGEHLWSLQGAGAQSLCGIAVGGAGDLDGDGFAETLVGTRHDARLPGSPGSVVSLGRRAPNGGTVCLGRPNSTGGRVSLALVGSLEVADDDLTVVVWGLPTGASAQLLSGRSVEVRPHPVVAGLRSDGNLCIGAASTGGLGRHPAQFRGPGTGFRVALDLSALAAPTSAGYTQAAAAGQTWVWQAWYLEPGATARSNFSDAVRATLR